MLAADLKPFQSYIHALEKKLAIGDATEQSYYDILGQFIREFDSSVDYIAIPKHIKDVGAPDLAITKNELTIGRFESALPGCWRIVSNVVKEFIDIMLGEQLRFIDAGRLYPLDEDAGQVTVVFDRPWSNLCLQIELKTL